MGRDENKSDSDIVFDGISIHSPRMGRDALIGRINDYFGISIHSPRMGRDFCPWITLFCIVISIHSPRMGRDLVLLQMLSHFVNFNPLSPHGERQSVFASGIYQFYFNPLSPHGERRCDYPHSAKRLYFNPLSPHGERQQTHTTFRREKLAHLHNIVSFRQQRGSSC